MIEFKDVKIIGSLVAVGFTSLAFGWKACKYVGAKKRSFKKKLKAKQDKMDAIALASTKKKKKKKVPLTEGAKPSRSESPKRKKKGKKKKQEEKEVIVSYYSIGAIKKSNDAKKLIKSTLDIFSPVFNKLALKYKKEINEDGAIFIELTPDEEIKMFNTINLLASDIKMVIISPDSRVADKTFSILRGKSGNYYTITFFESSIKLIIYRDRQSLMLCEKDNVSNIIFKDPIN